MEDVNQWLDKPNQIRTGGELDVDALQSFLREHLTLSSDSFEISQFSKGYSNLTYLIESGGYEFVLRRPPFGANVKSGHNMFREYKILKALDGVYEEAPHVFLYSEDHSIIDAPFYIMERVNGVILRANMPDKMIPTESKMKRISDSLIDTLVEFHEIDYEKAGLSELGRPDGYVDRQVHGWIQRFENAKTEELGDIEFVTNWLSENIPSESRTTLIHNDFKYDNLVLDKDDWSSVVAVLDWEMCTLGDPLMDLGTTVGYWINHDDPAWMKSIALNPTILPGNPTRGQLVQMYAEKSGNEIEDFTFYYVYGLFKIAGITQQIYYRYKHGHTQDQRFARLNEVVGALGKIAKQAIIQRNIDDLFRL